MVARFAGASLGLLAFATTAVAGLYVGNPPTVTLSRSILALFAFCLIGLLLGKPRKRWLPNTSVIEDRKSSVVYASNPLGWPRALMKETPAETRHSLRCMP